MKALILALSLALAAPIAAAIEPGPHAVTLHRVIDGDTVVLNVTRTRERVTVRIVRVDAPETVHAKCERERVLGLAAKAFTERWFMATGRLTLNAARGRDKYGRVLGSVTRDGADLGQALLVEGHARPYTGGKRRGWC